MAGGGERLLQCVALAAQLLLDLHATRLQIFDLHLDLRLLAPYLLSNSQSFQFCLSRRFQHCTLLFDFVFRFVRSSSSSAFVIGGLIIKR
uniref:Putative secreted protein n=1 Tax=Anopheles darlingi TaxID=43151 RepID=A0A2M4D8J5_ANODA